MTIYTRKPTSHGIPIVPMLDILTILLIFFIVQTEFKRQVSVLDIALPQTHNLAGKPGSANDVLLELAEDGSLALDGTTVAADKLVDAVKQLRARKPDAKIQFSAAEGASMGTFIHTLDTLSAAGLDVEQLPTRIQYRPE